MAETMMRSALRAEVRSRALAFAAGMVRTTRIGRIKGPNDSLLRFASFSRFLVHAKHEIIDSRGSVKTGWRGN
jgi:hypothetical protein